MNGYVRYLVSRAFDLNPTDRCFRQTFLQIFPDRMIGADLLREMRAVGIPCGRPVLGNAKSNPDRMYFLSHYGFSLYSSATWTVMWLLRLMILAPRPFARARKRLRVGASSTITPEIRNSSMSAP